MPRESIAPRRHLILSPSKDEPHGTVALRQAQREIAITADGDRSILVGERRSSFDELRMTLGFA
jgi:hypothetical protein